MSQITNTTAPQFSVVPLSGVQIYRRLPLVHLAQPEREVIWKVALAVKGKPPVPNPLLPLIRAHIACDQRLPCSDWFACSPNDSVFFRLIQIGTDLAVDLVIETQSGPGRMEGNRIDCLLQSGMMFARKRHHLATFSVIPNHQPRNLPGTLVMDFGNTATAFIFAAQGAAPLAAQPLALHNPFDPYDTDPGRRPQAEKAMFRSTSLVLQVPDNPALDPWLLLGKRAEELIPLVDPLVTSLYAPKKYVRDWPDHLRPQEPTTDCRGVVGQMKTPITVLRLVERTLKQLLTLAISSQVNPQFSSHYPKEYPQVKEVLLTYPLTWREQEKVLFQRMIHAAATSQFVLPDAAQDQFAVRLVCSEPVAVAAHALWEVFFHFYHNGENGKNLLAPSLVSSFLGNPTGEQDLRILVVDIGGGSTDIALVRAEWSLTENHTVDLHLQVLESLRFNRAGDRLSHIVATAILEYMRSKYRITEVLDYDTPASNPAFTRQYKRAAVSQINRLAEEAKAWLAANPHVPWLLSSEAEGELLRWLEPARGFSESGVQTLLEVGEQLEISLEQLRRWVMDDHQSMKSLGRPGFMDIFHDLEDMATDLRANRRMPHLVLLSGRTSRLPFLRRLAAEHLRLPPHRIRTLDELLPRSLHGPNHPNIDKFAVVLGGHRFQFGHPIRFIPQPEEPLFRRFVGTLQQTMGLRLHQVLVRPGDAQPQTCRLRLSPGVKVLIGHVFRQNSDRAEVIATIENTTNDWRDVEIDLITDYRVELKRAKTAEGVRLTERVPGGEDAIVDNFNDTGRIDREPDGLLRDIVLRNRES